MSPTLDPTPFRYMAEMLPSMEALLRSLVELNSGSSNIAGIECNLETCQRELESLGFSVSSERAADGRRHLLCHRGAGRPSIMLVGHLDTVYEPSHPFQSYARDGETMRGPGVADMKGGVVTALFVARYLVESGLADRCQLTLLLNSDEEISSPTSAELIRRSAEGRDACLIFESARPDGTIVSARKGVAKFLLRVHGVPAHAGLAHAEGRSAIVELARLILAIESLTDYRADITINVGVISGGEKLNVIPAYAEAKIDMRFADNEVAERAIARMRALAARLPHPDVKAEIEGGIVRPAWPRDLPSTQALVSRWQAAARVLGFELEAKPTGGGSDGNLTAGVGAPTLDGLGPVGGNLHSSDEWASYPSLAERAALTALAIELDPRARATSDGERAMNGHSWITTWIALALLLVGACSTPLPKHADAGDDAQVQPDSLETDTLADSSPQDAVADWLLSDALDVSAPDLSETTTPPDCSADGYCNPDCSNDPDCQLNCEQDNFCNTLCPAKADPDCPVCELDGTCDARCTADPDCGCTCNFNPGICEPQAKGQTTACSCDPDCLPDKKPCALDGHCDSWCPANTDPDCGSCDCNFNDGICEPQSKGTTTPCPCDPDCANGKQPCAADGHCDSWCPTGTDPDC